MAISFMEFEVPSRTFNKKTLYFNVFFLCSTIGLGGIWINTTCE